MKIFAATLLHETLFPNAFATTKEDFAKVYLTYQGEHNKQSNYWITPVYRWRELAGANNDIFIESLAALANPSGPLLTEVFEEFCTKIVNDLIQHHHPDAPVDCVLLHLHGAMVVTEYADCEAILLEKIRAIIGTQVPIGIVMDLHAHHTLKKSQLADVIIYYHEYPHTDLLKRADELFALMQRVIRKHCKPKIYHYPIPMLNHMLTIREPMRSIVEFMQQHIDPSKGIETVSIAHGFPWSDVPETGVTPVVIANQLVKDAEKHAAELVKILGAILYATRNLTKPETFTLAQALAKATQLRKQYPSQPVVFADYPDNPGGGALGCSTFALQELMSQRVANIALSSIWDEVAVGLAFSKGINQELTVKLGGSTDTEQQIYYGKPLLVRVRVHGLIRNFQDEFAGGPTNKGDTVCLQILAFFNGNDWIEQNNCHVIVNSIRDQTFSPICFTAFGIAVEQKSILIIKSMYHYQAAFKKIAVPEGLLTLAINGRLTPNFSQIPYQRLASHSMWPIQHRLTAMEDELEHLLQQQHPILMQFIDQLINQCGLDLAEACFPQSRLLSQQVTQRNSSSFAGKSEQVINGEA